MGGADKPGRFAGALSRVVPRWGAARARDNLVAIHARIGRAPRRSFALALAGAALVVGTVAVAAVVRLMRARATKVAPVVPPPPAGGEAPGGAPTSQP